MLPSASFDMCRDVLGTISVGIHYVVGTTLNLLGFMDSNWQVTTLVASPPLDIHPV